MQKKLYYILFISNTPVPVPTSVGATGFMASKVGQVVLLTVLVFTNRYDAGSAARPLYYSNRIESSCFPFGLYSNCITINVFGNMV